MSDERKGEKVSPRYISDPEYREFYRAHLSRIRRRVHAQRFQKVDKSQLTFEETLAREEFEGRWRESKESKDTDARPRKLGKAIGLLFVAALVLRAVPPANPETRPPFNAEYLLYLFLRRKDRDEVIGDLRESYGHVVGRFGKRKADIWFYKQVAGSLWPLLRRVIVKIGALVWLGRMLRKLIS
jgi:hypothetical protein